MSIYGLRGHGCPLGRSTTMRKWRNGFYTSVSKFLLQKSVREGGVDNFWSCKEEKGVVRIMEKDSRFAKEVFKR